MPYNPHIHHRKSIRLKGYDYAQAGFYFITICTQNRECLFGEIRGGEPMCSPEMILNDAGNMIAKWYHELENKYPDIRCHEMIVMPNHFHCIVENVGADLRVCPDDIEGGHVGSPLRVCPDTNIAGGDIEGEHVGSPQQGSPQQGSSIPHVVQWFKTMTTNEYIRGVKSLDWKPFNGKLWQRNYWEHIIRRENDYNRIAEYIINNPKNWGHDTLYRLNKSSK